MKARVRFVSLTGSKGRGRIKGGGGRGISKNKLGNAPPKGFRARLLLRYSPIFTWQLNCYMSVLRCYLYYYYYTITTTVYSGYKDRKIGQFYPIFSHFCGTKLAIYYINKHSGYKDTPLIRTVFWLSLYPECTVLSFIGAAARTFIARLGE